MVHKITVSCSSRGGGRLKVTCYGCRQIFLPERPAATRSQKSQKPAADRECQVGEPPWSLAPSCPSGRPPSLQGRRCLSLRTSSGGGSLTGRCVPALGLALPGPRHPPTMAELAHSPKDPTCNEDEITRRGKKQELHGHREAGDSEFVASAGAAQRNVTQVARVSRPRDFKLSSSHVTSHDLGQLPYCSNPQCLCLRRGRWEGPRPHSLGGCKHRTQVLGEGASPRGPPKVRREACQGYFVWVPPGVGSCGHWDRGKKPLTRG